MRGAMRLLIFRWRYIVLPLSILALSLLIAAFFYPRLPADLACHFTDGAPDRWLSRSSFLAWMLVPQLFLSALAAGIVWGVLGLSRRWQQSKKSTGSILIIMGNMVALPQVILSFAMLNIFSYNAYGAQIMPLWIFTLIVMVLGGIALVIFFILAIRKTLVSR
jgi:uncharacterized membrane protein